jgi:hypothetical protein
MIVVVVLYNGLWVMGSMTYANICLMSNSRDMTSFLLCTLYPTKVLSYSTTN